MALLARVADRLYWAARYLERAEDTARIIRAHHELVVDYPGDAMLRWEPLCAISGAVPTLELEPDDVAGERAVLTYLIADRSNPGSIVSCVSRSRENLRTTREVMPREAWQALNGLSQYVDAAAPSAVRRRLRDRFLARVIDDSRRLDGVLDSTMTRANPFRLFRLGRLVERAEMTTRVVGVRAAVLLQGDPSRAAAITEEVEWLSVLSSLSALQMYQRARRGPIEGAAVVRFLLFYSPFPRSVQSCLDEIRSIVSALPSPQDVLDCLDRTEQVLAACQPLVSDGHELDDAMDRLQNAIAVLDNAIWERYVT